MSDMCKHEELEYFNQVVSERDTLRSQVERLTRERDELALKLCQYNQAHEQLTQERDQATAACAVIVKKTNERERDLRAALLEFVRVENNFGHSGQDKPEDCADCKRVIAANKALSHGYFDPLSNEAITLGNSLLERLKEARELLGGARDSMNVVAECGPCECHLHRELCIVCDCENKVKSTDAWLKGTP